MDKQATTATRRALLGAAAALPAIATLSAPALATVATDRRAWKRAFAAMEKAKAALDADDQIYDRINSKYRAACQAIPHVTTQATYEDYAGQRATMTTAEPEHVVLAKRMLRGLKSYGADSADYVATCRELLAAHEEREAAMQRINDSLGYGAAYDRNEDLGHAAYEAETALILMPAPDAEALLWKLDNLFGAGATGDGDYSPSYSMEWINRIIADVRDLTGAEA